MTVDRVAFCSTVLTALAVATLRPTTTSAQSYVAITGIVVDSATSLPIDYASAYTTTAGRAFLTGETGMFRLDSLRPGEHTITVRKLGYVTRSFSFTIESSGVTSHDVGAIPLARGTEPTTTVNGVVLSNFGLTVGRAGIMLDGVLLAVAGDDGSFTIDSLGPGLHLLEVRRIGYRPTLSELLVGDASDDVDIEVTLDALPLQLEEITVTAERTVFVSSRLRDFYDRRDAGFGTYLTKWDIEEQAPMFVTDVLRRAPGVMVRPSGFGNTVEFLRGGGCTPSVYIDGMRLGVRDIDGFLRPEDVHGIEVYTSALTAPMQYSSFLQSCGVVLIWTN